MPEALKLASTKGYPITLEQAIIALIAVIATMAYTGLELFGIRFSQLVGTIVIVGLILLYAIFRFYLD
jgi:hypothetical protein